MERGLQALVPLLRPAAGPLLDVGAGSGLASAAVLERVPGLSVLALEPDPALRALFLGRAAAHPAWRDRLTIRPERFQDAPLPTECAGALALGVLGHFAPADRRDFFAALGSRLRSGGALLIDLQEPLEPEPVEPFEYTCAVLGGVRYRMRAQGSPLGGEAMRWTMTYTSEDAGGTLTSQTVVSDVQHPSPATVEAEARAAGLTPQRLGTAPQWVLCRAACE